MDNNFKQCVYYETKESDRLLKIKKDLIKFSIWIRQKIFKKFEIPYIEMFITTKCNLRCENCSNLIPRLNESQNFEFSNIKNDIISLLKKIDRLYRLKLHGGEVFLHPDLPQIINFCNKQKKIRSIRITTNGTILPSQEVLKALSKSRVIVQISDYNLPQSKVSELIELFQRNKIKYAYLKNQRWRDMGDFSIRDNNRFEDCNIKRCTSLYKGKIYICSRMAIANEIRLVRNINSVSIYQNKNSFRSQLKLFFNGGSKSACSFCDGDTEYAKSIVAGKQEVQQ